MSDTRNIIEKITEQVEAAVEEHRQGEDVHYAVSLAVMPGPQGAVMPVIVIVISLPGGTLGERLAATHIDQNLQVQATTPGVIKQSIEALLTARTEAMKQALSNPHANGQLPAPPAALVDPSKGR